MSAARADRVQEQLSEHGLDAVLVTHLVNVRWLTGFTGTNAVAVVGADGRRTFLTDFRYVERAEAEVSGFDRHRGGRDLLADAVKELDGRVGFEDHHLPVRTWERLKEAVGDGVELKGAGRMLEELRAVKEEEELEAVRTAARLADEVARTVVLEGGLAGRTERDVARSIERELRERGAEPSFPPIIAAAENGALPHAEPRDVEIPADTLVVVDWGAQIDGYCSDCTRTFATGTISDGAREVYELVERAQAEALAAVAPGASCKEVDAVARTLIADAGHGERVRPWPRPRRRPRGARGAAPHRERRRRARGRERGHGRAGRLPERRHRGADRGSRGCDRGWPRGAVRAPQVAHTGLESAVFGRLTPI